MCAYLRTASRKSLVAVASVAILTGLFLPGTALARIVNNTIDPTGVVSANGRSLVLTGPLACTAHERAYVDITVTQRATGAVAAGRARIECTGEVGQWELHATTQGAEPFQVGEATAVALARTVDRGVVTDAHQWLVAITLTSE